MKKYLSIAMLLVLSNTINAQKDPFEKVQTSFIIGQIDAAKIEYDKVVTKTPAVANTANGYLWKCRLLCEKATQGENLKNAPYLINEAHEAFMKYQSFDPTLKELSSSQISSLGLRPFDVVYAANFTIGRGFYQAKNYDSAYFYYDRSAQLAKLSMSLDLRKNGGVLDTIPIIMTGYSAQNAKMLPQAIANYGFAIDNGFGGKDDVDMYKYVLYGYTELKDKQNFDKYLATAQRVYPTENWDDYKLDFMEKNTSFEEKVALYDKEDAAGSLTYTGYMSYGNIFYNLTPELKQSIEKDQAKKDFYHNKAKECFSKAFVKNTSDGLAAYNVGVIYYNDYNSQDDLYREGIKALQEFNANRVIEKDPKKKVAADAAFKLKIDELKKKNAETDAKLNALADFSIEWYEKSVNVIKEKADKSKQEKQSIKSAVNNLINLFEYKRNRVRGKDVKAFDAFDAKYKLYDELYGKL